MRAVSGSTKMVLITLGSLFALIVIVAGYVYSHLAPRRAHVREFERLWHVCSRNRSIVPPGVSAHDWQQLCGAPTTALANHFSRAVDFLTEKLRAMADNFEARWPEGPKSPADILKIIEAIEAANPRTVGYSWHEMARELMKKYEVPALTNRQR